MISDYFNLALRNFQKRKLRTLLTMLGIFISIATIFTLISLSLGLQTAVDEQFKVLGTDKFFIMPKGQLGFGTGGAVEITSKDVEVIEKVQGVKDVSYATVANAKIEFNNKIRYYIVIGIPVDRLDLFIESTDLKMDEGDFKLKTGSKEVIVGYDYKYKNVFGESLATGDRISINDELFKVLGVVGAIGNPQDDKNIYMELGTFKEFFNSGERIDQIIVQVDDGADVKEIANRVEEKLQKFRGVSEKNQDFSILTPEELLESFQSILLIITAFLASIAAISLLVGGIGIANTMYTSVIERTKEIGIMKAIGARNSDIMLIFLTEAGLLGLVGASIGVGLGYGIGKIVEYYAITQLGTNLLQVASPLWLILGCFGFGFLIGAISGTLPAWQASKTNVVDALRYE